MDQTNAEPSAESTNVLQDYLEVINANPHRLQCHLCIGSKIKWFGCTYKATNITRFLRYKCSLYKHTNFDNAKECDIIQIKNDGERLAKQSALSLDVINPKNKIPVNNLKTYADSDIEDDEEGTLRLSHTSELKSPDPRQKVTITEKYMSSDDVNKNDETSTDEEDEDIYSKSKRLKREHTISPFSYLKCMPTITKLAKDRNLYEKHPYTSDTSSEDEIEETSSSSPDTYTTIKYLESTGTLQMQKSDKITKDRRVKLRLSYRKNVANGNIQYVLIVYEDLDKQKHLKPCRLLDKFNETVNSDKSDVINDDIQIFNNEIEQPAMVVNESNDLVVATVETPNTEEIAAALETATFSIAAMRTPTKSTPLHSTGPKRKERVPQQQISGVKRLNQTPTTSTIEQKQKRGAARCLRL